MNSIELNYHGTKFKIVDPKTYPYGNGTFDEYEPIIKYWNFVPGEVAIDIGASFGCYALSAIALGADVVAFEPSTDGHRILTENIALNGWEKRCAIHKVALYGGSELPRELTDEVFGFHYRAEDVIYKKLDDYGIERASKLKMDIEGAELPALEGGVETIKRCRPLLLIEDHDGINAASAVSRYPESIDSSRKIHELLRSLNYDTEVLNWGAGRKYIIGSPRK